MPKFLFFCVIACLMVLVFFGAVGARQAMTWTLARDVDGSQTTWGLKYGCIRYSWGAADTILSGDAPGFRMDDVNGWDFEWWFVSVDEPLVRVVQVPVWPAGVLLLGLSCLIWKPGKRGAARC
jgi:hypothetical protein